MAAGITHGASSSKPASQAAPAKKKGTKVSKADVAIGKIRKLYAIEKRIEAQRWTPSVGQRLDEDKCFPPR
ncbi:hypothetical protein [Thiolapillus sp.]|uniref:hypothetical protein n=1 Tax=Thiolapillus sp. TaxID=2017437 RepID=UPI003AF824A4